MQTCGKISTANRNADKMGRYLNKGAFIYDVRYFLDIFDLPTYTANIYDQITMEL